MNARHRQLGAKGLGGFGQDFGYRDYEVDIWYGLVAPVKTPKESISQLADWFTVAKQVREVAQNLLCSGSTRPQCVA